MKKCIDYALRQNNGVVAVEFNFTGALWQLAAIHPDGKPKAWVFADVRSGPDTQSVIDLLAGNIEVMRTFVHMLHTFPTLQSDPDGGFVPLSTSGPYEGGIPEMVEKEGKYVRTDKLPTAEDIQRELLKE